MIDLDKFFDRVVCLTVDKRPKAYAEIVQQLRSIGTFKLPFKFISITQTMFPDDLSIDLNGESNFLIDEDEPIGWSGTRQSWNYYRSLWSIIRRAKLENWDNFLFIEDDAWFQPNFQLGFQHAMNYISDFDMLYLGANHHSSPTYYVAPNVLRGSCILDMHCVAINHTMYDKILNLQHYPHLNENPYCDVTIAHLFHKTHKVYSIYPSLVYQYDGWSENEQRNISRIENWQHPGLVLNTPEEAGYVNGETPNW